MLLQIHHLPVYASGRLGYRRYCFPPTRPLSRLENPIFDRIALTSFLHFAILNTTIQAIAMLTGARKELAWAGGFSNASVALYQSWGTSQILKDTTLPTEGSVDQAQNRYLQRWLDSDPAEVYDNLQALRSGRVASTRYLKSLLHGLLWNMPSNVTIAFVHPRTFATAISLAPGALFTNIASVETDEGRKSSWTTLAAVWSIGIPGTFLGMANQATLEAKLTAITSMTWSAENAERCGRYTQNVVENMVKLVWQAMVDGVSHAWMVAKQCYHRRRRVHDEADDIL